MWNIHGLVDGPLFSWTPCILKIIMYIDKHLNISRSKKESYGAPNHTPQIHVTPIYSVIYNTYYMNSKNWALRSNQTNCMDQSPFWEADTFSASQEFPRILCNTKLRYSIYKCPPPVEPDKFNPCLPSYYLKININPLNPELNPICYLLALLELIIFSTLAG